MNEEEQATLPCTPTSEPAVARKDQIECLLKDGDLVARHWATSNVSRVQADGRNVYVKQYLPGDLGVTADVIRKRTEREISVLARLAASPVFGGRPGVLRLVAGDPDSGTLVTEEVPGVPLHTAVVARFRKKVDRECLTAMYLVGKWLRLFQSLSVEPGDEVQFTPNDPSDLVAYCNLRVQKVLELGYGWPSDAIRRRLSACLADLVRRSSDEDRRRVWCHADYAAGNIIWDGSTLTPIDFGMCHLHYPLVDVTYFIHRLEMLPIYFPWRRWPLAAWKRAVLRGYGRPDAERSPMYRALMIKHLHCRLQTYVRRPRLNLKQRVHNAWVLRRVRANLLRMVSGRQPVQISPRW